jgi:DNA-binding MarR family transcriptional regulator
MQDDELRHFRDQMRMLGRRLRHELPSVHGVSRSAVHVLRVAARAPDPSPSDVAEKLRMTSSNVAAALRELESAGLVCRGRDPEDGRRVRLSITAAGADAVSCMNAERDTWLGRATEALLSADEQLTLLRAGELMQRLAEYDDAATADAEQTPAAAERTGGDQISDVVSAAAAAAASSAGNAEVRR